MASVSASPDPSSRPVWLALTTAPGAAEARRIAAALLEERLAACANIVPGLLSVYRWQGRIHQDSEVLLLLKTTADALSALETRLLELHPYDTPEFLAFEAGAGSAAYLDWVADSVAPPASRAADDARVGASAGTGVSEGARPASASRRDLNAVLADFDERGVGLRSRENLTREELYEEAMRRTAAPRPRDPRATEASARSED